MSIIYEKKDKIAIIKINRPEVYNALDFKTLKELESAWYDFRDDDNLWVAILTGSGDKAFCCGADLKEIASIPEEERKRMKRPPGIHKGIDIFKPIICGINGLAVGGGLELALASDIRVASEGARFGLREVCVGLIPAGGGTQRLTRIIPFGIAMEMLLTGKLINADESLRIGLVNKVVPLDKLMSACFEYAEKICENAPIAVRSAKESAIRGLSLPLQDGLRVETLLSLHLRETEDAKEGPKAFAEKRKPNYKGK
jgi:enoyl-CoA hydratase/carnithine racemase